MHLKIDYTVPVNATMSIDNNFSTAAGTHGLLKVNSTTQTAPYSITKLSGSSLSLEAITSQTDSNGYERVWNSSTSMPTNTSNWKQLKDNILTDKSPSNPYTYTVSAGDDGSTYKAYLYKNYHISRNKSLPESNATTNDGVQVNIVDGNSGAISAPSDYTDGNNNAYKFYQWSDYYAYNPRSISPSDNTTYTAVYKAVSASNDSSGYTNPGSRKFVRTRPRPAFPNGILFNTYESMGQIWLETSTDNGVSWQIFNNNSPISGTSTTCKSPSIAFADNVSNGTTAVAVTYYDNVTNSTTSNTQLNFIIFNFSTTLTPTWYRTYTISSSIYHSSTTDLYLSTQMYSYVDTRQHYRLLVVYGSNSAPVFSYWYGMEDSTSATVTGTGTIRSPFTSTPKNPALAYGSIFHLAYQGGNNVIYYTTLTENPNYTLSQDTTRNISTGNSYTSNEYPSINIPYNGSVRVAWRAYKTWYNNNGPYIIASACLTKINSSLTYLTYDTNCVQVNLNSGWNVTNDGYVMGWSSGLSAPYHNYFVKSDDVYTIHNFNTSGKYLRVCNGWGSGTDYSDMACLAYNTSSLPYKFTQSASSVMQKSILAESAITRAGVAFKDSAQFMFQFGDISVDGQKVLFPELPDSGFVNSFECANQYLVSNPFTLTDNSVFQYSVFYAASDTLNAKAVLDSAKTVSFKLQLEDAETGEPLGMYDGVTFTKDNARQYKNVAYEVSANGIGSRKVVLRLIAGSNTNMQCSILQEVTIGQALNKKNFGYGLCRFTKLSESV